MSAFTVWCATCRVSVHTVSTWAEAVTLAEQASEGWTHETRITDETCDETYCGRHVDGRLDERGGCRQCNPHPLTPPDEQEGSSFDAERLSRHETATEEEAAGAEEARAPREEMMAAKYKAFRLLVHVENAAFAEGLQAELCRVLRQAAKQIETTGEVRGRIVDSNGNACGSYGPTTVDV